MATIVLVHGGWSGGWNWRDVARRLRAAGHEVYAPTLTGLGERVHLATPDVGLDTHVTDIVNVLAYEDLHDVILVGHSYGGMVIAGVAGQAPERLAELVYLDAFAPFAGESLLDLVSPEARRTLEEQFRTGGDEWRTPGHGRDTPRHVAHPWKCFAQALPAGGAAATDIPRTYVRFTADKGPASSWPSASRNRPSGRGRARGGCANSISTTRSAPTPTRSPTSCSISCRRPIT